MNCFLDPNDNQVFTVFDKILVILDKNFDAIKRLPNEIHPDIKFIRSAYFNMLKTEYGSDYLLVFEGHPGRSEKTRIGWKTWTDLKEEAMADDYKTKDWFVSAENNSFISISFRSISLIMTKSWLLP